MRPNLRVLAGLLLAWLPATLRAQAPSAAEYAVWSVALDSIFGHADARRLVVTDTTTPRFARIPADYDQGFARRLGDGFPVAAVDSMRRASRHAWPIGLRFRTRAPVQRLSEAGRPRMRVIKDLGDEPFEFTFYPGSTGIIGLSRVGFDSGGRYAAVMVEYHCGPLCANVSIYGFRCAGDGGWELTGIALLTQS